MQEVKYQKGVGLLDILVALLLLAIAVLGFVALQLRAVEATAEGANRIQAMNIARDLAEKMRINSSAAYPPTVPQPIKAILLDLRSPILGLERFRVRIVS